MDRLLRTLGGVVFLDGLVYRSMIRKDMELKRQHRERVL